MVRPECNKPFAEAAIGKDSALQPRQRLGAKRLLDDIERLLRRLRRVRLHRRVRRHRGVGLHGVGRGHAGVGAAGLRRLHLRRFYLRRFSRDVGGDGAERQVAPLHVARRRLCRLRWRGVGWRRPLFRSRLTRELDLLLIFERGPRQRGRRLQPGHFEQHAARTAQLGLDEAARVGRRVDEIARRAAARAESKAVERDKRGLRIAGHPASLAAFCTYIRRIFGFRNYTAVRDELDMKNTAKFFVAT